MPGCPSFVMSGNGGKIRRTARSDRTPESHGVRLQLILAVGAVVVLLGYFAFRPSKSSPESVLPREAVTRSPLAVVVPKRHMATSVVREAPARETTPTAIQSAPSQPTAGSTPAQSFPMSA